MGDAVYVVGMRPVSRQTVPDVDSNPPRDLFLVTSSAEIDILEQKEAMAMVEAVRPINSPGPDGFVSMACVGFVACILEFLISGARDARILLLETPAEFVQASLDLAQIGGGDGFIAEDVSFVVDISRTPEPDSLRIYWCEILARPRELFGTAKLAARIFRQMREIKNEFPSAEFVTFENCSEWSRRLAQSLLALASQGGDILSWLPSIENGRRHFMTVRPVLDLSANIELARKHPLVLACLGAGGRFGIIILGPDTVNNRFVTKNGVSMDLGAVVSRTARSASSVGPKHILYVREEFFGKDNFYFKWTLQRETYSHA